MNDIAATAVATMNEHSERDRQRLMGLTLAKWAVLKRTLRKNGMQYKLSVAALLRRNANV